MKPPFYDTHAHLDFPDFAADLDDVLLRATEAGITRILSIGTTFETSRNALALAAKYPQVYAVVGFHPSHVTESSDDVRPTLRELARQPKVAAIGEAGLDYHRLPSTTGGTAADDQAYKQRQARLFTQQLEVAAELGLNCVIHERDSFEDAFALFQPHASKVRGVFHCYVNTIPNMQRIIALGSLVSFTGIVTFKNAQPVRDCLAAVPEGKFMLETDCPFLSPVPFRGKRGEPARAAEIAACAATVRDCSLESLSDQTCQTASQFFRGL